MNLSDKLSLKWNEFKETISTSFVSLRKNNELSDVTLACEDGQQLEAHKVVLALSSPFFQNLLIRNKHTHPLLFMRGIRFEDLVAIVDFMYHGEANIYHENLNTFLKIACELQLKGLNTVNQAKDSLEMDYKACPQKPDIDNKSETIQTETTYMESAVLSECKMANQSLSVIADLNNKNETIVKSTLSKEKIMSLDNNTDKEHTSVKIVPLIKREFSGDFQDLDEEINTMMTVGDYKIKAKHVYTCNLCGKQGIKTNIKNHIEVNHITGLSFSCNLCEKSSASRPSLWEHKKRMHK